MIEKFVLPEPNVAEGQHVMLARKINEIIEVVNALGPLAQLQPGPLLHGEAVLAAPAEEDLP